VIRQVSTATTGWEIRIGPRRPGRSRQRPTAGGGRPGPGGQPFIRGCPVRPGGAGTAWPQV